MNDKDTILVDRIRELEDKLSDLQTTNKELQKKLRQPIRIVKSFQDLWTWWWRTEERQALTVASVLLFCIIVFFIAPDEQIQSSLHGPKRCRFGS